MKTIRIEKIDKEMISPDRNPLTLYSTENYILNFGDIRQLDTGLKFFFPEDIQCMFEPMVPDLLILGKKQIEPYGSLCLVSLCYALQVRIGRMQPIAKMTFFEMKPAAIRFAEFGDGKRLVFGGKIETRTVNDNPKPGTGTAQ